MKVFTTAGEEKEFAMFAKNDAGKSVLVASDDFDVDAPECLSGEMAEYVSDELGTEGIVYYVEEI